MGNVTVQTITIGETIFAGHPFLSVHFILGEQKKVNSNGVF